MARLLLPLFALFLLVSVPAQGATPEGWIYPNNDAHKGDLSFMGAFSRTPYYGGGLLFGFPVAPRGFAPLHNDAFYLEFEAQTVWRPNYARAISLLLALGVRYQLFLFEWMAPYISFRGGTLYPIGDLPLPYVTINIGVMFTLGRHFAIRLEGGNQNAKAGITLLF